MRYKIIDLKKIISYTDIDLISITETKIDASFPDAQFLTEYYLLSDMTGVNIGEVFSLLSKMDYCQKHIPDVESNIEILPFEIRIDKSKLIVLNINRPPASNI